MCANGVVPSLHWLFEGTTFRVGNRTSRGLSSTTSSSPIFIFFSINNRGIDNNIPIHVWVVFGLRSYTATVIAFHPRVVQENYHSTNIINTNTTNDPASTKNSTWYSAVRTPKDVRLRSYRCSTVETLPSGSSQISAGVFTKGFSRDEDVRVRRRRDVHVSGVLQLLTTHILPEIYYAAGSITYIGSRSYQKPHACMMPRTVTVTKNVRIHWVSHLNWVLRCTFC